MVYKRVFVKVFTDDAKNRVFIKNSSHGDLWGGCDGVRCSLTFYSMSYGCWAIIQGSRCWSSFKHVRCPEAKEIGKLREGDNRPTSNQERRKISITNKRISTEFDVPTLSAWRHTGVGRSTKPENRLFNLGSSRGRCIETGGIPEDQFNHKEMDEWNVRCCALAQPVSDPRNIICFSLWLESDWLHI